MFKNKLIPWQWGKKQAPVKCEESSPLVQYQGRELETVFDDFFKTAMNWPFSMLEGPMQAFNPRIDLSESDRDFKLSAELPGLEEDEIEVLVNADSVTISSEKKEEKEEKTTGFYRMERNYGSFRRVVFLPGRVNTDKIEARFKNGLLTLTLPKAEPKKESVKRIEIKS